MFVKTAVRDRAPDVSEAEASQIALRIINAALAPPQITPLARVVSNAYILDGTNIPPSKCLEIVRMASTAYSQIRESPGFTNYLQYIKDNSHKVDYHRAESDTSPDKRQGIMDKLQETLEQYKSDPDGRLAIETAKTLGEQVAQDAKIPVDQLPAVLRPQGATGKALPPTKTIQRTEKAPAATATDEESSASLPTVPPTAIISTTTQPLTTAQALTTAAQAGPVTVTQFIAQQSAQVVDSVTMTFTADWLVTKTVDFTQLITQVTTATATQTVQVTSVVLQTGTVELTEEIKSTETVYQVQVWTLTTLAAGQGHGAAVTVTRPTTVTRTVTAGGRAETASDVKEHEEVPPHVQSSHTTGAEPTKAEQETTEHAKPKTTSPEPDESGKKTEHRVHVVRVRPKAKATTEAKAEESK